MKQRFTSFLLLLALSCAFAFAGPVTLEQAKGKAAKFMKELNGSVLQASETPEYAPARTIRGVKTNTETPAYYVFNSENESGYVIVSGDDNTDEILGYSTNGSFDMDNMPENVKAWLHGYTEQIALMENYVHQEQSSQAQYSAQWTAIAPMTSTKWNQGSPYNNMCPLHEGTRSVTGCTATAMAQVMKFHNWPEGETSPIPGYETATAKIQLSDLPSTTFRWDEMYDTYGNGESGDAVAELMLYCGQAITSDYTSFATGSYTGNVTFALKQYFGYDNNLEQKSINFYTISEWETIIYDELKQNRPVYHAGYSMDGGHAFICDGYDGNGMFHFNWGWGGMYDGYFKLSIMAPGSGGIGSGSSDGYSSGQEIIIGIQPPTGEGPKPWYFMPHSEQLIGKDMFAFFCNTHTDTKTANVGFATIDENDNIIKVIKNCGGMTLQGNMSQSQYIGMNLEEDGIRLSKGTHRIATVCRPQGASEWKRVGSSQNYFLVTTTSIGRVTAIDSYPKIDLAITDWACTGTLVEGMPQTVNIKLKNNGDEVNQLLYLYASPNDDMGEAQSRTCLLMKKNEEREVVLDFNPYMTGNYNVWLADDDRNVLAQTTVNIAPAPTRDSNISLSSFTINDTDVSATIRVMNNSSETYYRGFVVQLFENLYSDGYLYATETQEIPCVIEGGRPKTLRVQFHGANSYNQCAVFIHYYANHRDEHYTNLGRKDFVTGETPVESIEGTPEEKSPAFRIDGTRVKASDFKGGIFITDGKKMIAK